MKSNLIKVDLSKFKAFRFKKQWKIPKILKKCEIHEFESIFYGDSNFSKYINCYLPLVVAQKLLPLNPSKVYNIYSTTPFLYNEVVERKHKMVRSCIAKASFKLSLHHPPPMSCHTFCFTCTNESKANNPLRIETLSKWGDFKRAKHTQKMLPAY